MTFLRIICLLILFCSENAIAQSDEKASSNSENINFTKLNAEFTQ